MTTQIINKIRMSDIKTINVTARRWFQKSYGNTYHSMLLSAVVTRETANRLRPNDYPINNNNGDTEVYIAIGFVKFQYGYGDHYENTALRALIDCVEDAPDWLVIGQSMYTIRDACKKTGWDLEVNCRDVDRKKDL